MYACHPYWTPKDCNSLADTQTYILQLLWMHDSSFVWFCTYSMHLLQLCAMQKQNKKKKKNWWNNNTNKLDQSAEFTCHFNWKELWKCHQLIEFVPVSLAFETNTEKCKNPTKLRYTFTFFLFLSLVVRSLFAHVHRLQNKWQFFFNSFIHFAFVNCNRRIIIFNTRYFTLRFTTFYYCIESSYFFFCLFVGCVSLLHHYSIMHFRCMRVSLCMCCWFYVFDCSIGAHICAKTPYANK